MHKKEVRIKAETLALAVIVMLSLGTVTFSLLEGWSVLDSLYFVTMTATTVGYGDFAPTHAISKVITIIYALSMIPLMLYAFSMVARYQTNQVYKKIQHKFHEQAEDIKEQEEELEKTEKLVKKQKKEISEHDKELEVVEKVLAAKVSG